MKNHLSKGFLGNQSGQTLVEYIAIAAVILLVVFFALKQLGNKINEKTGEIEGEF